MARIHENIERLFGPDMTEETILDAFRLDHPGFTAHPMAEAHGAGIFVHGDFHSKSTECKYGGSFKRLIYRDGSGVLVAHHQRLDVLKPYRKQDIAKAHLTKLVQFYDANKVEYIHLEAVDDGPLVWPQLGFEFQEPRDVQLLHHQFRLIVDGLGYEADPPRHVPALAYFPPIEGVKVGLRALRTTYAELGERPIPMVLDLHNTVARSFLQFRGILGP